MPTSQVDGWIAELDAIELHVRRNLEPLSDAQLNWRPGPARWSISECLDHLAITTTLMLGNAGPALERARAQGKTGGDAPLRSVSSAGGSSG